MKLGWNVNQYGSDGLLRADLARAAMLTPGCAIRLDAVNDYLALKNAETDDPFIIPDGTTFVTKIVKSVQLPSPFTVIFRGPMAQPNILNHSAGSDPAHRPYLGWDGSLSTPTDLLVIDTKFRTVKHNGSDVDLSAGSTWFELSAGDNLLSIGRQSTTDEAACSVRHTNPAVRFDWSDLTRRVQRVRDAGHFPMLMVPYWVPGENKVQVDNLAVMVQHAYFCQQLGIQFKNAKVYGVQGGNEPNLAHSVPEVQAKVANLVMPLFPKTWKRVAPGMSPGTTGIFNGSLRMSATDYLAEFWPLAGQNFDFVGIHPYGSIDDLDQPWSVLGMMPGIYNDITRKPFWCTEYNGVHQPDSVNAAIVGDALVWLNNLRGRDTKKIVPQTFIYAMTDPGTESNPVYKHGCYDGAGHARPIVDAIKHWLKHKSG